MNYKIVLLTAAILLIGYNINAQMKKDFGVDSFTKVKFEGSAEWVLIPSDEEKVIIESKSEEVFEYIDIEQKGDYLIISTTDKSKSITKLFNSVTIKVYFKSIVSVSLSGVGNVKTKEKFTTSELKATLRGTGNMYLDVNCSEFIGNIYGTGVLFLNGGADTGIVRVEGVGGFDGYEFITKGMNVTVSGVGGAKVNATDNLIATLNGVGSIKYKGDPKTKDLNTNGIGHIKKMDD